MAFLGGAGDENDPEDPDDELEEEESKFEADPDGFVSEPSSDDVNNFNGSDASNNNSSASDFVGNDSDDPVSHIHCLLKKGNMLVLVLQLWLSIFKSWMADLSALKYLAVEILDLSGNAAHDNKKHCIVPCHLQLSIPYVLTPSLHHDQYLYLIQGMMKNWANS